MNKRGKMIGKIKILSVLFIICLVVIPISSGKNSNIPIYIQTQAGIERAIPGYVAYILFNNEFEIILMEDFLPDEKCSIRAELGSLEIDGMIFDSENKLNFHIPSKNSYLGQGSLTSQKDRNRFSLSFDIKQILETNIERLVFRSEGEGSLNKEGLDFDEIIVSFDKTTNKVDIIGSGDKNFNAEDLEVSFKKWCDGDKKVFYLIIVKDKLEESRNLEEVEELVNLHPELVDDYENLKNPGNVPLVPEFGMIIGTLTLLSAVGIFFIIRRH